MEVCSSFWPGVLHYAGVGGASLTNPEKTGARGDHAPCHALLCGKEVGEQRVVVLEEFEGEEWPLGADGVHVNEIGVPSPYPGGP